MLSSVIYLMDIIIHLLNYWVMNLNFSKANAQSVYD